jgi:hypothetical protein
MTKVANVFVVSLLGVGCTQTQTVGGQAAGAMDGTGGISGQGGNGTIVLPDSSVLLPDGGTVVAADAPGSSCTGIAVTPGMQSVTVTSLAPIVTNPQVVTFQAQLVPAGCYDGTIAVAWGLDPPDLATIDGNGVVTIFEPVVASLTVKAYVGGWSASGTLNIQVAVSDNSSAPAGAPGQFGANPGGTGSDSAVLLYPYSGTVFPKGIEPPVVQWSTSAGSPDGGPSAAGQASAVRLSLVYPATGAPSFAWSTIIPESTPPRSSVQGVNAITQAAWNALSRSASGKDAAIVLQRIVDDQVLNELRRPIHFATAQLRGRIYYTEYYGASGGGATSHANIMRIAPGIEQPAANAFGATSTGCPVCHSMSANGRMFVTSDRSNSNSRFGGISTVNPDGSLNPIADSPQYPGTTANDDHRGFAWAALSPDGKYALQGDYFWGNTVPAAPTIGGDNGTGEPYMLWKLLDDTGQALTSPTLVSKGADAQSNWGLGTTAMMVPSFSPDGNKLVFVDGDTSGGAGWRKGLSTFDVDLTNQAFSNRTSVVNTYPSGNVVKWPFFESDSKSVVFCQSTPTDLCYPGACTGKTAHGYGNMAPTDYNTTSGNLWSVDVTNPKDHPAVSLDNLNLGEGDPALRRTDDANKAFQPTVLPTAAGGYRWVVFASTRPYGNTQNLPSWTTDCLASQLWVAAIDDVVSGTSDRSHPAFWLPDQNHTDSCSPSTSYTNERAYWVLDPCTPEGGTCASTDECCQPPTASSALSCSIAEIGPPVVRKCAPSQPPVCVKQGDVCTLNTDCCDFPSALCIGGTCQVPPSIPQLLF